MSVRPVFIMSLPRSGSTLLQRMLAAHPQVATSSEPWILLPQLYALRPHDAQATYGHRTAARAIVDLCEVLPGGRRAYLSEVERMVLSVYELAADGAPWFVDKTPRYHLIVDEMMSMFPTGRFVFLWRNPLAAAASMIESFGNGRWNLDRYSIDLHGGLERLVAASLRADPRATALRYEDLVADPRAQAGRIFEFLALDQAPDAASGFSAVELPGRMGDRTGRARYSTVSSEPLDRWRETMRNPLRKRWCRRYLDFVGDDRLAAMGYDAAELRAQVAELRTTSARIGSDVVARARGVGGRRLPRNLITPNRRRAAEDAPPGSS
jgi:Sulfotransferase family